MVLQEARRAAELGRGDDRRQVAGAAPLFFSEPEHDVAFVGVEPERCSSVSDPRSASHGSAQHLFTVAQPEPLEQWRARFGGRVPRVGYRVDRMRGRVDDRRANDSDRRFDVAAGQFAGRNGMRRCAPSTSPVTALRA